MVGQNHIGTWSTGYVPVRREESGGGKGGLLFYLSRLRRNSQGHCVVVSRSLRSFHKATAHLCIPSRGGGGGFVFKTGFLGGGGFVLKTRIKPNNKITFVFFYRVMRVFQKSPSTFCFPPP